MKTTFTRRQLVSGAVTSLAGNAAAAVTDLSSARNDFPWGQNETFLNNAGWHPIGVHSIRAIEHYLEHKLKGPGEGRNEVGGARQNEVKRMFA